ncbi:MAG: hypothetical protein KGJ93_05240 [Patescibacteria group bacterium]|nr:hypothetical protein [Patescibacteria group bacterium]
MSDTPIFNAQPAGQPPEKPSVWATNSHLKTLLLVLIFVFLGSGIFLAVLIQVQNQYRQNLYVQTQNSLPRHQAPVQALKSFVGREVPVRFNYPAELVVAESGSSVNLNHQIPFENHGACDMKGDTQTYPTLSDFNVNIQLLSGTVAQAVRQLSPYMPPENFSGDTLKISPGFIDAVQIGQYKGFSIYEGAEGCGHTIYYFPVFGGRVLVMTKDMVQQLSGVISSNVEEEILKVPGVISPEKSDQIFRQIIESLQILPAH